MSFTMSFSCRFHVVSSPYHVVYVVSVVMNMILFILKKRDRKKDIKKQGVKNGENDMLSITKRHENDMKTT